MSRVRGGQVFVEIGADPARLFKSLNDLNKHIGKIGSQLQGLGTRLTGFGAALAAPIGLAARQFASFDDVLRNVQASTGATTAQLEQIRKASMAVSEAMGIGPTEIAQGFLELLKAGMSLEQVLGGAGQAAIAFGKVGGLAVADAAVVMADAMNVFRVSGDVAANTLSGAADASSTSIEGIAQAFAQASAVAGLANQSIQDTAASLAILANAGIKGSDAGTSLKTMLMRLMAPAEDAVGALDQLGLSAQSFRGADGQMRPMVEIIRTLTGAMAGMDQAAKDDIFRRIFGQDAIRAAAVMTAAGVDGFTAMRDSMAEALPVGEKFAQLTGGLSGAFGSLMAATARLGIAIGGALAPSLQGLIEALTVGVNAVGEYVSQNQSMIVSVAKAIATFMAVSAAILAAGTAMATVAAAIGMVLSPLGLVVAGLGAMVVAVQQATGVFGQMGQIASDTFGGMYDALAAGDLGLAMEIVWAGAQAALLRGVDAVISTVDQLTTFIMNTFDYMAASAANIWDSMGSGIQQAMTLASAAVMGVVDNLVNGVMAAFDTMVAKVQKSWNYVQSFIVQGYDLEAENRRVDDAMSARARQREVHRPGVTGRIETATAQNAALAAQTQQGIDARNASMNRVADNRVAAMQERERGRGGEADMIERRVAELRQQAGDQRAIAGQVGELDRSLAGASNMQELQQLAGTFRDLRDSGKLSADQLGRLEASLDDASERVMENAMADRDATRKAAMAGAAAAQSQTTPAEVVGTFSGAALGQMGFGQNLAQRQLDEQKKTNQILNERLRVAVATD